MNKKKIAAAVAAGVLAVSSATPAAASSLFSGMNSSASVRAHDTSAILEAALATIDQIHADIAAAEALEPGADRDAAINALLEDLREVFEIVAEATHDHPAAAGADVSTSSSDANNDADAADDGLCHARQWR